MARRGVDVRALGRVPRRRACGRAPVRRPARRPAWLRWLVTFHLVVLGWILFRSPDLATAGTSSRGSCRPGRRRCGPCPWSPRSWSDRAPAAAQRPLERSLRIERLAARPCSARAGRRDPVRRAPPCRARACRRSSTSASEADQRHHRDDSLMDRFEPRGTAALPRARRAHRGRLARAAARAVRGPLDPPAGRGDGRRAWARRRAGGRQARPAWVADRLPLASSADTLTAWLSPDDEPRAAPGGFDARRPRPPARQVPARDAGRVRPRARSARRAAAPRRCARCSSPATRWPSRSTTSSPGARRRRRQGDPRPAHRHRHLEDRSCSTGASSRAQQVTQDHPDAVVVFIGANEGFPMPGPGGKQVDCCGADWAADLRRTACGR